MSEQPTVNLGPGQLARGERDEGNAVLPESFGRYQVIRQLGAGGMGSVFLARDGVLAREVAIKSLVQVPGKLGQEFNSRFLIEARCVATLAHPNIVPIYDLGLENEIPYLVMEVLSGPSLSERIAEHKLAPRDVRMIGIQMANALAEAHRAGIVHRDVKPANILLAGEDRWKLVDFGVARAPDSTLTGVGHFLGTPSYAAPECLEGDGFSAASDVYGLGATLYHVLCGQPPYGFGNAVQIALRASAETPRALTEIDPDVPASLAEIVSLCMSRNPAERPTASALAELLASGGRRAESVPWLVHSTGDEALRRADALAPSSIEAVDARTHARAQRGRWAVGATLLVAAGAVAFAIAAQSGSRDEAKLGAESTQAERIAKAPESQSRTPEPSSPPAELVATGGAELDGLAARPDPEADAEMDVALAEPAAPSRPLGDEVVASAPGQPEPEIAALEAFQDVQKLVQRRANSAALRALDRLRKSRPASAYLPYLQGTLYMAMSWWQDGFDAYRAAIARDPRYRSDERMIRDGIRALSSKSKPKLGEKFLVQDIGVPARPMVEAASKRTKNSKLRSRLQNILRRLPNS